MPVLSPSKFLSINFLQDLKLNAYISAGNKEYCQYEVEVLLMEKLQAQGERIVLDFNKALQRRALEEEDREETMSPDEFFDLMAAKQKQKQEVSEMASKKVIKLAPKRKEIAEELKRRTCIECSHVVESEDDWAVGQDYPAKGRKKIGELDSGIYICPKCSTFQKNTMFDGLGRVDEHGGIDIYIPGPFLKDFEQMITDGKGVLSFVQGLMNSMKKELIDKKGDCRNFLLVTFPQDAEEIENKYPLTLEDENE